MTEEKLDELSQQFGGRKAPLADLTDDDEDEELEEEPLPRSSATRAPSAPPGARQELERRLADARARRRAAGAADVDVEEPLA